MSPFNLWMVLLSFWDCRLLGCHVRHQHFREDGGSRFPWSVGTCIWIGMASHFRRLQHWKGHFPYTVHKTARLKLFLKCGWPLSIQQCRVSWDLFQLPLRLYMYFIMSSMDGNLALFCAVSIWPNNAFYWHTPNI